MTDGSWSTRWPSRTAPRSSRTRRPSSRSELLAVPPLAAAAIGVFYDGGYSAGARIAFACASAVALAVAAAAGGRAARRPLREPLVIVLGLLAAAGALSVLWTLAPEGRTLRWAAVTAGYACLVVAAAVAARTPGGRLALAAGVGAIAAASAVLGLAATVFHEEPYALRTAGEWRPAGPLEYSPALALLTVCALPAYLDAARARGWAIRAAGLAGIVLTAAVLALAASRVAVALGVAVAGAAVWRASIRRSGRTRGAFLGARPNKPPSVVWGATVVAVAVAAGALSGASGDGPHSGFLHGREDTWRAAVETFLDRPLHGAGADAFLVGSARHQDGAAIAFAHDLPLELAAELGALGLLLALALYAATVRLVWHARAATAAWLFGPAALAFLLANLVDWPWHLAGMGAVWAVACGALAGSREYAAKVRGSSGLHTSQTEGDA